MPLTPRTLLAVVLALVIALGPAGVEAQDDLDDARAQREQVRRERAAAAAELDVSRAADAELAAALEDLTAQVSAQHALVDDARRRLAAAEAARVEAEARVAEAAQAQEGLWATLRDRAISSFVGEGVSSTSLLLSVEHPTEALRRAALVAAVQADTGDVLEDLRALEEDRQLAQAEADAAVSAAATLRDEVSAVLEELDRQRQAQAALKAEMERRVAEWQSQVASYTQEEEELTRYIQAEVAAAEARRRAAEEEARRQAEEEARRQAEEQARQAAEAESRAVASASGSGDASASGSTGGSSASPPTTAPRTTAPTTAAPPRSSSSSGFQWPVSGRVSSGFGYRVHPIFKTRRLHAGLDVGAGSGTPIYAAKGGTVLSAGWRNGYGNTVMILHDGGLVSLYAHQSRIATSAGASVDGGELIGYVGSTGWSTGPHLHFEIRVGGSPVDPRPYLP